MVATFDKVDGKVMKLGDIGVDEDFCFSTLSFLKAENASTRTFKIDGVEGEVFGFSYYFTADLEGTDYEGQPGWYYVDEDAGLHPVNDVEVPFGSMFYVEGAEDANIVASGVVLKEVQPVDVLEGMYNWPFRVLRVIFTA